MYKKILLIIIIVEVFLYVFLKPQLEINLKHVINIKNKNPNINNIKLENYVIGVVAAEMPATFSFEALKAQAVASRTFIYKKLNSGNISYDNISSDKGQAYIGVEEMKEKWKDHFNEYYNLIKKAVYETKGEVIYSGDEIIKAYYFSSSNGITEDASVVFGEENYLVSVEVPSDKESKEYLKTITIESNDFLNKLGLNGENIVIGNINRSKTNHVSTIEVNGNTYSGTDFRKILNLRSTDFDIEVINNNVTITTRGYGHGVGMSQYGANYLGNNGSDYKSILNYFYNNIEIRKI